MPRAFLVLPALWFAGWAAAQGEGRPDPSHPQTRVPPVEYRSAFNGYRPFNEEGPRDWRKSNDEVGAMGGHTAHRPGQGPGKQSSKPQPGKPESSRAAPRAPQHEGHGGHK
jgi:hypothetical protein